VDSLDGFAPVLYDFPLTVATFTVLAISISYVRSPLFYGLCLPALTDRFTRLFLEFFSKKLSLKTSNVIVELVRLAVLWICWLSAGAIYYSFFHGPVPVRDCKLFDFVDRESQSPSKPTFNLTTTSPARQHNRCYGLIVIPILCLINFALRE
jgi:hypothetical protein